MKKVLAWIRTFNLQMYFISDFEVDLIVCEIPKKNKQT